MDYSLQKNESLTIEIWPNQDRKHTMCSCKRGRATHTVQELLTKKVDFQLPTEDAKNQVEDKKRAEQNQRHKVDPWPFVANSIINLKDNKSCALLLNHHMSRMYDYSEDIVFYLFIYFKRNTDEVSTLTQ